MKKTANFLKAYILCISCILLNNCTSSYHQKEIRLAGPWDLALDSLSTGPANLTFNKSVQLPGTLAEASIGNKLSIPPEVTRRTMFEMGAIKNIAYVGKAWYRKKINVPAWARGKTAILDLERVMWKSTVYVDGKETGSENSLSVPHRYDVTGLLNPGQNEIMICIDNSRQLNLGGSAQRSAWNGILGDFKIKFLQNSYITKVSVYPDAENQSARVRIQGKFEQAGDMQIRFRLNEKAGNKNVWESVMDMNSSNEYVLNFKNEIREWDEFDPSLYILESSLLKKGKPINTSEEVFGFRKIESDGKLMRLNGKPIFLRGTAAGRSLPPYEHEITDPKEWGKIFTMAKSYGLNHFRFASGSPPEAAYEAADKMGFYLQVECPIWSLTFGRDSSVVKFISDEADRIINEYGNHPSFCMMTMGNEMEGDYNLLTGIVSDLKAKDRRILYSTTTYTFQKGHGRYPEPVDDYLITQYTDSGWVRGQGVFDFEYPAFDKDFSRSISHIPAPVIEHELGQHTVFPELRDIEKYNSVIEPVSLKDIKADLDKRGLAHLVDEYINASGKLQVLLYKEDIERAMKTSGVSGFQLLALFDVVGNSAFGGVLNPFWEPKKYIDSTEFREFCSEAVPLAWFSKAVYSSAETLDVEIGVANFYRPLMNRKLICELSDNQGAVLHRYELSVPEIEQGKTKKYGRQEYNLAEMKVPGQFKLTIMIEGTKYRNSWPIWIYPEKVAVSDNEVMVTGSFNEAEKALNEGKKVLLSPPLEKIKGNTGRFITVFWSPTHFSWVNRSQIGTMGLLIDPKNPAFSFFPTESHSNWQWWDLCKQSESLEIDSVDIQPLLTVIDNYFKNRRLTSLFETKAGKGKLIFSSIDLISNLDKRIEARQLRYSLLQYMKGDQFNPKKEISMQLLRKNFEDRDEIKTKKIGPYD